MTTWRKKVDELVRELQQDRDELRVKAALGKSELKEELAELDGKLDELRAKAADWADQADDRMDDAFDEVKERTNSWMKELKEGYRKVRERLASDDTAPPT